MSGIDDRLRALHHHGPGDADCSGQCAWMDTLRAAAAIGAAVERDQLRAALMRYGIHEGCSDEYISDAPSCAKWTSKGFGHTDTGRGIDDSIACTCGLDAAAGIRGGG